MGPCTLTPAAPTWPLPTPSGTSASSSGSLPCCRSSRVTPGLAEQLRNSTGVLLLNCDQAQPRPPRARAALASGISAQAADPAWASMRTLNAAVPERIWAIMGCRGIGRHLANRLLADGE